MHCGGIWNNLEMQRIKWKQGHNSMYTWSNIKYGSGDSNESYLATYYVKCSSGKPHKYLYLKWSYSFIRYFTKIVMDLYLLKTVWIWKWCILSIWYDISTCREHFESNVFKLCILTLFDTIFWPATKFWKQRSWMVHSDTFWDLFARRLFRPTGPIVATPVRHQHHHCHRNNHHTSGFRGDPSKSSSISFKLSTIGCSSKI